MRRFTLVVATAAIALLCACQPSVPLEDYGAAPSYTLTDQTGGSFSSGELRDRVSLVAFIYTRCPDVCPVITPKMQEIQRRLKEDQLFGTRAVLVSVSVDPIHDTPEVLSAYGKQFDVDASGWKMLTGEWDAVYATLAGFKVGVRAPRPPVEQLLPGGTELSHTKRVALVDRHGTVRAYFNGVEDSADYMYAALRQVAQ